MTGFRDKMAKMIADSGDELWELERFGEVGMWYIKDKSSYNDPLGREPQYQVWNGEKRCYVGSNRTEAYADFEKQKKSNEEFIANWALI